MNESPELSRAARAELRHQFFSVYTLLPPLLHETTNDYEASKRTRAGSELVNAKLLIWHD